VNPGIPRTAEPNRSIRSTRLHSDAGGPPLSYENLVDSYLSETHRDHPGTGCPLSALACDIARGSKQIRSLLTEQVKSEIEIIDTGVGNDKKRPGIRQRRADASPFSSFQVFALAWRLRRLQQLQEFERVYAPFDGVITARNTDIGALVQNGPCCKVGPGDLSKNLRTK
jgi:hypothetical protein